MSDPIDFVVRRADLHKCKFTPGEALGVDLKPGQVRLRVEKFGFTANNITYAVYGDAIGYWGFFPAEEGWGRVPVWGFGEVVNSSNEVIAQGQRYYGYFPMSTLVTMDANSNSTGFRDAAQHRQALPGVYNQYFETAKDPGYDREHENEQMILRPLFITSFLAHDYLADKDFAGAKTVVVSSASSKTAYALAFLLSRDQRIEVIGLTSEKNQGFTRELGCYDRVITYDAIESLTKESPATFVDVAGSAEVREALQNHLGGALSYSMALGDTHWQEEGAGADLVEDREFFFAPNWLTKRVEDWGMQGYGERLGAAWRAFRAQLGSWMKVVEESGPDAVQRVYLDHLNGRADPKIGNVLTLAAKG
jgi:hypothetical protein